MLRNLGTGELILIIVVVVVLFGGNQIPELMKGLGRGVRILFYAARDNGDRIIPKRSSRVHTTE